MRGLECDDPEFVRQIRALAARLPASDRLPPVIVIMAVVGVALIPLGLVVNPGLAWVGPGVAALGGRLRLVLAWSERGTTYPGAGWDHTRWS